MRYNKSMSTPLPLVVIQHEDDCPPSTLAGVAERAGVPLRVILAHKGEEIPTIDELEAGACGIVVLGGGMGPFDDADNPWLPACRALCVSAVERSFPLLGICLGEEILAVALGAEFGRRSAPEIGIDTVTPTEAAAQDPVFGTLESGRSIEVFQWHQEQVMALPRQQASAPSCELLAINATGDIQAFRAGSSAWGVQFHPEIEAHYAAIWARTSSLTPEGRSSESYALEVSRWLENSAAPAHALMAAFVEYARATKS